MVIFVCGDVWYDDVRVRASHRVPWPEVVEHVRQRNHRRSLLTVHHDAVMSVHAYFCVFMRVYACLCKCVCVHACVAGGSA